MVAKTALSTFSMCLGAAVFAATLGAAPSHAKSQKSAETEEALPDHDASQPMTLIVSLSDQQVRIYRGAKLITSSRVSSGKRGYATKTGVFSILEKKRHHYSNLYAGAPMPWMQRLTWSGTALHAGPVPNYPASHGCVRLPYSFAPKLFSMTTVGGQVVVSRGRVEPKLFEHATLFQPLPPPMPPIMAKDHEQHMMRRSSNETAPAFGAHLPVVLAKAETDAVVTDAPQSTETPASAPVVHGFAPAGASAGAAAEAPAPVALTVAAASAREDTRVHAIDPNAAPFVGSGAHAVAVKPGKNANHTHAEVGTSDDFVKHQDRLAASEAKSRPALAVSAAASSLPATPAQTEVALVVPAPGETPEPQAGPILSVSAAALPQPLPAPVLGVIAMATPAGPPPLPPAKPSVVAAKLVAGAAAAAVQAAEPRSTAPLRVLVTRRTQRDRMIGVQYILASMGHLEVQDFDGTFGRQTASAIKDFQKAHDLPETGAFTDDVVEKIYEVAGKEEPPTAHLFVRQEFASVFDTPVTLRNPDEPLGTHVFTVMNFAPGDTKAQWMAVSLKDDDDPSAVLDRIEIPEDVRQNISERLTPGSSFIIADTAINSATLPKGADFLVWDTSKPAKVHNASVDVKPRPRTKRRAVTRRRAPAPTYSYRSGRSIFPF